MDTSMKCLVIKIIVYFIIIATMIGLAVSITEMAHDQGSADSSSNGYGTKSHYDVYSSSATNAPNRVTISSGSSGSSGSSRGGTGSAKMPAQPAITVTSAGDPIKIVKIVTPRIKDGERRLGEMAQVRVEIYSNQNETVKLDVREFVDENLPVFRSSANGYVLNSADEISYYKLGLLEDLESGCLDKKFSAKDVIICDYNCNINLNQIKKYDINESWTEYMRMKEPLICLPIQNGCNLSNYPYFAAYLKRMLNLNDTTINNMTINCTKDENISIKYNGNLELKIFNNSSDYLDSGNAIFISDGIVHHLIFMQNKTNNNKDVFDTNNIMGLDKISLEPDSIVVFWYNIMPYNPGVYDTETLAIIEKPKKVVSAHLEIEIEENSPQFKISRKFTSPHIFKWDELGIQYHIDYIGGGPRNQITKVPISFNNSSDFKYILGKNEKLSFVENFFINHSVVINKTIKYKKEGEFTLPSLWINNKYIDFGENERTVIVDIPFERYFNGISLLFAGITFIIGILLKDIYLTDPIKTEKLRLKIEGIIKDKKYKRTPLVSYFILALLIIIALIFWLFKPLDLPGF
jgi:hypothetical protein